MPKSIRIRTEPGVDRDININIDQDFDFLEILSLKLRQEDLYTQFCADYGVVVGRVISNGGLGIPNAHISIFIPIDEVDENNPIISTLYPYKSPTTKNEDGYRYNLLPYTNEYYGHTATGTFPTVNDVLTRKEVLQVYEKYYKYSVRTNDSGDFMIVGVPLGSQKLVMDLDLSNMGEFSLRPSDLVRMGLGVASQFNGQLFKSSENLNSLPQIITEVKDIDVSSFWGQDESCDVGITRADFDLRDQGIDITPHTSFMGSIFSSNETDYIKASCRPKKDTGNLCDTISGPGQILAIRHTIKEDVNGDPVLEEYKMEEGGNVIDSDGVWLVDLPMNLEYITTNEFGERVTSFDPTIGVATKAKYRFKVKWQNEAGLQAPIMRANYLIPNIKEHWVGTSPSDEGQLGDLDFNKSYAFSLDWDDYYDKDAAIKCEDTFYLFGYNKVYTTAAHIDRFKFGMNRASHYGIKEILDKSCMSETNRFPMNDGQRNFDFIFFLFNIVIDIVSPMIISIIPLMHVLAFIYPLLRVIVNLLIWLTNVIIFRLCQILAFISNKLKKSECQKSTMDPLPDNNPFMNLTLPMMTYPDCEACSCTSSPLPPDDSVTIQEAQDDIDTLIANEIVLADFTNISSYVDADCDTPSDCDECYEPYIGNVFSGYELNDLLPSPSSTTPPSNWIKSPFSANIPDTLRSTYTVTLPQSLNLMNQRSRYFDSDMPNRMRTQILNSNADFGESTNPSPGTNQFEDMPMITVMDSSYILEPGQLVSFVDSNLINDPNLNNDTLPVNDYGYNSITGDVERNNTEFINKSITYIDGDGNQQTTTLQLENTTIDNQSYSFKSGIEYFQVIGSMTVAEMRTQFSFVDGTSQQNESILWNYFINKTCQWYCGTATNNTKPIGNPLDSYDNEGDDLIVYFFTRGVDPYSPKQKITYDLSRLFGVPYGDSLFKFENNDSGGYYLNRPIQGLGGVSLLNLDFPNGTEDTPASHFLIDSNTSSFDDTTNELNNALYGESFLFTPNVDTFVPFESSGMAYYASIDYRWGNDLSNFGSPDGVTVDTLGPPFASTLPKTMSISTDNGLDEGQGRIDGASYQWTNKEPDVLLDTTIDMVYTIAPSYWFGSSTPPMVNMSDSSKLIVRSDRLPTSSNREQGSGTTQNYQDFPLHLNSRFSLFKISDLGESILIPSAPPVGSTDNSGNQQDMTGDTSTSIFSDGVLESFSCQGLKVLDCYSGSCTDFGVSTPCENDDRTIGGCYVFVSKPFILSIFQDVKYFFEWRTRFRFMFGACKGVVGHMFQNNWINGTLYMPSFQKKSFFDGENQLKRYKYCGDPNQSNAGLFFGDREHRGPMYFNTDSNSFYYRSTPFYNGEFIPQITGSGIPHIGSNDGQLWQPTTIMDLGPKTDFLKEILLTPEFQGYIIDKVTSTSYQDTSGLLNLFIISRLVDASFLENILGNSDASIQSLFSRQEDGLTGLLDSATGFFDSRVDGDYAQMISINTEFGVLPYLSGNYADSVTVCDGMFGVWFTGETENRRILGPGELTFSETPLITSQFNYPGTQEIPYYTWETQNGGPTPLFGTQQNKWITDTCGSDLYQDSNFNGANEYPKSDVLDKSTGYLYNANSSGVEITNQAGSTPTPGRYRVGSPFQFYFGLGRGKSAINRFITKEIFLREIFNDTF